MTAAPILLRRFLPDLDYPLWGSPQNLLLEVGGNLFKSQQINQGCWFRKMISSGYEEVGIRCCHASRPKSLGREPGLESVVSQYLQDKSQIAKTGRFITLRLTDVMKLGRIEVNWNKVPNHRRTLFISCGRFHENKSIIVGNHWCVTVGVWYGRILAITQVYTAHPLHHPPAVKSAPCEYP